MLSPAEVDALACTGRLKFICCLTKQQFFTLAGWTEGMGDRTKERFYETACCTAPAATPPATTPTTPVCPPNAIDVLCGHLNEQWLEAAAELGILVELNVETGPLALIGGIIASAATAASALCFDKTVNDASKTALCNILTYGDSLVKMASAYPLAARVLGKLMQPEVLSVLTQCCAAQLKGAGP